LSARFVTFTVIFAALLALGGANPSYAQTAAPIVYARSANTPMSFDQFQGRAPSGAIDLRPGASKASFGPAIPATRLEPVSPAVSAPLRSREFARYAEPYAGPPYQVDGKWYVPTHEPNYDEVGIASWYGPTFHGKASATGEQFNENAMTAAHPTLPIPSMVRDTNLENGKSVVVRLNDRGPFVDDRIIDMSRAAGKALDMHAKGTAKVRVQYIGPAPLDENAVLEQPLVSQPIVVQPRQAQPVLVQASLADTPVAPPAPDFNVTAKPLAPLPPAIEQRGYFVQAGSYADLGNAHAAMAKLRNTGTVSVVEAQVGDSTYYRVMVGPFASRPDAELAQGRLIEAGAKAIVVAKLN
jgi:rare lipoprotein A